MTSTKRKIYLAVIIVCFSASGAVLYFGLKSPTPPPAPAAVSGRIPDLNNISTSNNTTPTASFQTSVGDTVTYPTPVVFPRDTKFDWSLTESQEFKSLVAVPDLVLDPNQVGRPNPFNK